MDTRNPKLDSRVRHARGPDLEARDREGPFVERLDVERGGAEARLAVEGIESLVETRRTDHADAPARLLPAQVVAQGDEIDEMVGMEMADDDRVERAPDRACPRVGRTSPGRGRGARSNHRRGAGTRRRWHRVDRCMRAPHRSRRGASGRSGPPGFGTGRLVRRMGGWIGVDLRPWDRHDREESHRCRIRGRLV